MPPFVEYLDNEAENALLAPYFGYSMPEGMEGAKSTCRNLDVLEDKKSCP